MLNDAIPTRSLDTIRAAIATAVAPGHFFVSGALHLAWRHLPTEELPWENFHGRLLDATQTRQRRTFESWNIHVLDGDAVVAEPLLSLKLDAAVGNVYVTRGIKSYAWEAYDSGDNVILSRPVEKWLRELTAVVELSRLRDAAALREELAGRLRQAVLGVSRLPLTSVEAPLPAFSLGELAYFHQPSAADSSTPMSSWMELLERGPQATSAPAEQARLLECLLRGTPDAALPTVASAFAERWHRSRESLPALLLLVFNEAALSPYTSFVDRALAFARLLEDRQLLSAAGHADFLARLLRLVARHLTAFDLVKFHHRGANYPDALLLDAALKALLDLAERRPDLFLGGSEDDRAARLRRRGLRQGWLLRCRYQGHPVPESPTSPGENSRVLPAEFPHIADEEIAEPARRNKRLFADQAATPRWTDTGRAVLQRSIADLATPAELQELGTALFLDRPLGVFKRPTEPDRTPLLSYVAFSRTVAEQRLQELRNLEALDEAAWQAARQRLAELSVPGLPLQLTPGPARPGVPSLRDAFQTAHDFVLLFTTARSSATFWKLFDVEELGRHLPLDWLTSGQPIVIVGGGAVAGLAPHALRIYDSAQRPRLECEIAGDQGYRESLEGETPVAGLLLTRTWEVDEAGAMRENNIESRKWRLLPR